MGLLRDTLQSALQPSSNTYSSNSQWQPQQSYQSNNARRDRGDGGLIRGTLQSAFQSSPSSGGQDQWRSQQNYQSSQYQRGYQSSYDNYEEPSRYRSPPPPIPPRLPSSRVQSVSTSRTSVVDSQAPPAYYSSAEGIITLYQAFQQVLTRLSCTLSAYAQPEYATPRSSFSSSSNSLAQSPYQTYQTPRLPTSQSAGPLPLPFALPQTAAGASAPFLRGFSIDLERSGVNQRAFIQFVDALNASMVPNPEMQIANKAAGLAGWFVPGMAAGLALTGVQVVSQIGGAVVVKGATKQCLQQANRTIFGPCGLEVQLQTSQQLNTAVGYYGPSYNPSSYSAQMSQMNPALRLQQYDSFICPLSVALPPVQGSGRQDPLAQLGNWGTNRSQQKAEQKAREDAMKGKMKKADKIEKGLMWLVVTNSAAGVASDSSYSPQSFQEQDGVVYEEENEYYQADRKSATY